MRKRIAFVLFLIFALTMPLYATSCNDANTKEADEYAYFYEDFPTTPSIVESFLEKTGGFIKGVCHPNENYEQISDANIEWVRFDISNLPYDKNGNPNEGYLRFKERAKGYADHGIKVLAITPYPEDYIDAGLDPRDEKNEFEIMKIAKFYAEDLQGIVSAFQITNEMGVEHFTLPLTMGEAARFIGIQLKAMYPVKQNIVVGYNCGGILGYVTLPKLLVDYEKYVDYIGTDIYLGCFENIMTTIDWLDSLTSIAKHGTEIPIVMTEFGYIGAGQRKTDAEKLLLLQSYGAVGSTLSEAETYIRDNARVVVENENFPEKLRTHLEKVCGIDKTTMSEAEIEAAYAYVGSKLLDTELVNHLYCELAEGYVMEEYEHTQEGQAAFLADAIPRLYSHSYMCGTIVYCYSDSDACYICGQNDCPVETGWGLVDCDGNPKLSYTAVLTAFGNID